MNKSPEAFRTISEVAEALDVPPHVLRFWETRFTQVKPVKRGGGRRYYRPEDVRLLRGIRGLLYDDGMTIKGVQKILRERGIRHVIGLGTLPAGGGGRPGRRPRRGRRRRAAGGAPRRVPVPQRDLFEPAGAAIGRRRDRLAAGAAPVDAVAATAVAAPGTPRAPKPRTRLGAARRSLAELQAAARRHDRRAPIRQRAEPARAATGCFPLALAGARL